jgi:hypothetical protein
MVRQRTYVAAAALGLLQLGCDGVLGLRPLTPDPDAGVPAAAGTGGRGGTGGLGNVGTAGRLEIGGVGGAPPFSGAGGSGAAPGLGPSCLSGLVAYYPLDSDLLDHSGGGHDLIATDVVLGPGVVGGAAVFNGSSSKLLQVAYPDDVALNPGTLCAWIKPSHVVGLAQPVFATGVRPLGDAYSLTPSPNAASPGPYCAGVTDAQSLPPEGQPFIDHTGGPCQLATGHTAPSDSWSFVCYSFGGGQTLLFVNGGSAGVLDPGPTSASPLSSLTIGFSGLRTTFTGAYFQGGIDEVTVWNRALTLSELTTVFKQGCVSAGSAGSGGNVSCSQPAILNLTPAQTQPLPAGATATFDLAVTNPNDPTCPAKTYSYSVGLDAGLSTTAARSGRLGPLSSGATVHVTFDVSSATDTPEGVYSVFCSANETTAGAGPVGKVPASASYIVGPPRSTGITLVPDGDGHFDGTNPAGVLGSWWSASDSTGSDYVLGDGTCPAAGFPLAACSTLTTPTPGTAFRPDPGGRGMCTSGVDAQVILDANGIPAWSSIWGAIIGFNPNNPGTIADGTTLIAPYNAPAHGITGFAFDIAFNTAAVPGGAPLRVAFQTVGTENSPAYWMGATSDWSPISGSGHYEMRWNEIGGPMYVIGPPPFDPTTLKAIQFQVVASATGPVPFDFCVNNATLLTN